MQTEEDAGFLVYYILNLFKHPWKFVAENQQPILHSAIYKMTDKCADEDIFWIKEENDGSDEESGSSSDPTAFSLSLTPEDSQSGGEKIIFPNEGTDT